MQSFQLLICSRHIVNSYGHRVSFSFFLSFFTSPHAQSRWGVIFSWQFVCVCVCVCVCRSVTEQNSIQTVAPILTRLSLNGKLPHWLGPCLCVCLSVCVSVRRHLNVYISETKKDIIMKLGRYVGILIDCIRISWQSVKRLRHYDVISFFRQNSLLFFIMIHISEFIWPTYFILSTNA